MKTNFILLIVLLSFAFTTEAIQQCNEVCNRNLLEQHACCNANGYYPGIGCVNNQMFCGPPRNG
jgi:hypothetical protein